MTLCFYCFYKSYYLTLRQGTLDSYLSQDYLPVSVTKSTEGVVRMRVKRQTLQSAIKKRKLQRAINAQVLNLITAVQENNLQRKDIGDISTIASSIEFNIFFLMYNIFPLLLLAGLAFFLSCSTSINSIFSLFQIKFLFEGRVTSCVLKKTDNY